MDSDNPSDSRPSTRCETDVPLDVLPLHSTNLLTVLDENGVIQYESPSIERIYGYEQDELVGEQVAEYFHPDDREEVVTAFRTVVASEEYTVEAVEYRHRQADGTYLWVESVASANPTPDGQYVVNTRDISDQRERERELQETNERLEAFASIVSHDLRNPLNVAQGRLQLVAQDCDSGHLDDVARAHDRMETLITDLLTLSRVGKQISDTEPVSIERLSETAWQTVATADATLLIETDRHLRADRNRLRQLLENLFRNSVEHGSTDSRTQSGDSVEHGSTGSRPQADDSAERAGENVTVTVGATDTGFYVEDDGPGVPTDERGEVFEAGTSTRHDGTGLGLSIVRRIVDAHGWQVSLTDGTAGGARFEITDVEFV